MNGVLRSVWERLTLYLPLVLMGVLSLGTYWLVRNSPEVMVAAQPKQVQHHPDYFMRKFAVKTFDSTGKLKSVVSGNELRHYPDTDVIEIDQVLIRSFDLQGNLTTATARRATTNGDVSEVQLRGDARIVRAPTTNAAGVVQPAMTFVGEFLHAFMDTEQVMSDQPVVLTRGDDRFAADRLDFDNQKRTIQLNGRVKGVLMPGPRP